VIERTGWPLQWVSAAVTLHFVFGAFVVSRLPGLYACFGLPVITGCGALLLLAGVTGWSLAETPWQLVLAAMLSGSGWVTMGAAAINAIITPWFNRDRPRALSFAYNGASIGGVILSPCWVLAIDHLGFTAAALLICGLALVTTTGMAFTIFTKTPGDLGQHPDGDADAPLPAAAPPAGARPKIIGFRFITLAGGMSLGLFAQIGLVAHLFTIIAPDIGEQMAGLAMGLATASAIAGRSVSIQLIGRGLERRTIAAIFYAIQAVATLLLFLADGSAMLVFFGMLLFGSGIGNATSLPPLIAQTDFPAEEVKRAVPLMVATAQAVYAFAPAVFGLVRGLENGNDAFFLAVAAVQVAAMVCFTIRRNAS
jgi:MFS family permease